MILKNKEYEIRIEDLNNLGYGVGRVDGTVVFVDGAVDKDFVLAKIILVKKSYAVARVEKILEPSPFRRKEKFCDAIGCGGCAYADIEYKHELELKRERVRMAFRKSGIKDAKVAEVFSTNKIKHYRNKAQYPVAMTKNGEYIIGFYAPKSHRVVEARECPLQPKLFSEILSFLSEFLYKHKISVYDEKTGKGILRHIYLRSSKDEKECSLVLVINAKTLPSSDLLVEEIKARFPCVFSVMLNINQLDTNVVCTDEYVNLYGEGAITDVLCDIELKISPASFYQVNREVAERIYTKARELADLKGNECLLDLYCGIGSIGLSMAKHVSELIGIEVVPEAVECARENAKINGIKNASFFCADATTAQNIIQEAEKGAKRKISPDVIILDPPRKGCSQELLDYISEISCEKIVYISCNADTLARDAAYLTKNGYQMGEVHPFDMFPRTGHVESVVCFTRTFDNELPLA